MSTNATEKALEACIERFLTGGASLQAPIRQPDFDEEASGSYAGKGFLRV